MSPIATSALALAGSEGGKALLGGIGSGIGSGISKLFGGSSSAKAAAQQYEYSLALQKQAQEWNEYMYKHRYQFQRQDMENAGINPLFGMGQAPSVTSGMNGAGMADYAGEQNNKFNQMMGLLDFAQNLSAKRAQTKLIERQAQTEEQNTLLRTAEVLEKQINNKFLPQTRKAELKKMQADTLEALARTNESYANAGLRNAQTARENLESAPLKRYEEFVRKNPQLAKIIENIDKTGTTGKALTSILKQGGTGLRLLLNK